MTMRVSGSEVSRYWIVYRSDGSILPPRDYGDAPRQDVIVEHIVEALKGPHRFVVVLAGTGAGKSLVTMSSIGSYITPTKSGMLSTRNRGVVLTPTNSLANQYYEDFMRGKYILRREDVVLTVSVLFGKDRYRCVLNPKDTALTAKCNYGGFASRFKCPMYKPAVTSDVYAMLSSAFKVTAIPYECVSGTCYYIMRNGTGCKYYDDLAMYIQSSIVITNPWKYLMEFERGTLPSHAVTAIDEFDSVLLSMVPILTIDDKFVHSMVSRYNMHNHKAAVKLLEYVRNTNVEPYDVFHQLVEFVNAARMIAYADYKNCIESNPDNPARCNNYIAIIQDINALDRKLRTSFTAIRAFRHKSKVVVVGDLRSFSRTMGPKVLLVSATMLSDEVLEKLGIDSYHVVEGPRRIRGKVFAIVPPTVVNATKFNILGDPEFAATYAKALRDSVRVALFYRPTFISVPAYWLFENPMVRSALNEVINVDETFDLDGSKILEMRDGKRDVVISAYATRGMDLSYDRCRSIVIPKLPTPDVDTVEILATVFGERISQVMNYITMSNLYHTLSRAVRGDGDWSVVVSPDIRVYLNLRRLQLGGYIDVEWHKAPMPTRDGVDELAKHVEVEKVEDGMLYFKASDEVKQLIEQSSEMRADALTSEYELDISLRAVEIREEPAQTGNQQDPVSGNGDQQSG